jgi:autotransporter translocation and assembly factor TamB
MRIHHMTLLTAGLLAAASSLQAQSATGPSGHWEGTIQMPARQMSLAVDLSRNAAGAWIGSLTIPGSTTVDVPIADVKVEGTAVRFTARLPLKTSFDGTLAADQKSVSGTVSNIDGEVGFQLTRNGEANVKVPRPSSALPPDLAGTWAGTIDVSGKAMRIVLKLSAAADGTALATIVSVDRGNLEMPVNTVTVKDTELDLEARVVSGTYRGTFASGEIAGEWTQGNVRLPLTFRRAADQ